MVMLCEDARAMSAYEIVRPVWRKFQLAGWPAPPPTSAREGTPSSSARTAPTTCSSRVDASGKITELGHWTILAIEQQRWRRVKEGPAAGLATARVRAKFEGSVLDWCERDAVHEGPDAHHPPRLPRVRRLLPRGQRAARPRRLRSLAQGRPQGPPRQRVHQAVPTARSRCASCRTDAAGTSAATTSAPSIRSAPTTARRSWWGARRASPRARTRSGSATASPPRKTPPPAERAGPCPESSRAPARPRLRSVDRRHAAGPARARGHHGRDRLRGPPAPRRGRAAAARRGHDRRGARRRGARAPACRSASCRSRRGWSRCER